MTTYKLSQHTIQHEGELLTSYNIEFEENGILKCIYDVSTDFEAVSEFVDRLNSGKASTIHIYDMVEDFLLSI